MTEEKKPIEEEEGRCIKCGGLSINFDYEKSPVDDSERLNKRCGRCGYTWEEETLDNILREQYEDGGEPESDPKTT